MILHNSIKHRLVASHLMAVLVVCVVLPLALYWRVDATARSLHERALRQQAEQIAYYVHRDAAGTWSLDLPENLKELYSTNYARYGFAIVSRSGQVLFSNRGQNEPLFRTDPRLNQPSYFERDSGSSRLFGASVPVSFGDGTIWIQISQDQAHRDVLIDDIVEEFLPHVAWVVVPILLVLVCIDMVIFGRALRPLLDASALVQQISPAQTDLRLPEARMPSEAAPLVRAVNEALDRLERGFIIQREFLADAAHELRTPLAILRAEAEALADREAALSLVDDIEAMTRIVNQLIAIAESDALAVKPEDHADVQAVCAEVAAFMAPVAVAQGKSIAVTGTPDPVWIHGNGGALFQAIRNLVENAIAHTAWGTTVEIMVDSDGSVRVRDEGPGIPEEQHDMIFQRFWRGDRLHTGNAGLGLAIVSRIIKAHGGSIDVMNAADRGAVFSVNLRRAPSK